MVTKFKADEFDIDQGLEQYWASNVTAVALPFVSREFNYSILPALKATARRSGYTADQYKSMWIHAWDVTNQLFNALHAYSTEEKEKPRFFWLHQRFDIFRTDDASRGFSIMKGELLSVAALYLGQTDIRTAKFDWLFLDAIVFQELNAYGEHLLTTKAGTGINWAAAIAQGNQAKYYGYLFLFSLIGFGLKFLAPPVLAYYLVVRDHPVGAIAVAGLWLVFLIVSLFAYPGRRRNQRKATGLLQHLVNLYSLLGSTTISPRKLKEALDAAVAAGVVLDGAAFTIVDRLIALDPTAFIPSQAG